MKKVTINLGDLRSKITFLVNVKSKNEAKETILIPNAFKTVWASIEALKGRDYEEAKKIRTDLTYKIIIRYTTGITKDMEISFKDRTFEIIDIINLYEGNKLIQIMCFEKVD